MTRRNVWRSALALFALFVILEKSAVTAEIAKPAPVLEGWLLFVTGLIIFGESLNSIIQGARASAQDAREHDAEKAMVACIRSIHVLTGIDVLTIGGCVYMAERRGLRRRELLRRDVRFRISDLPQESDVTWTAGKGAVGAAWAQKRLIHKNWTAIARKYSKASISKEQFTKIPQHTRDGFTHREFQTIVAKYAEILAVPIFRRKACIGVIAIDLPMTDTSSGMQLNSSTVKEIASNAAVVISNVFGKK